MYHPLLSARKLLFIIFQCLAWEKPSSQSILNALLTLTHVSYLVFFQPLEGFLPLVSEILGQVCVFICLISTTFLYDDKNIFSINQIEKSFKYTVIVTISLQSSICFYHLIKFIIKLWKTYKTRRTEDKLSATVSSNREPEVTFIHARNGSSGDLVKSIRN